jgi:hypothetical protein
LDENGSRIIEQNNASHQMEEIKELQSDNESQNGPRKARIDSKMVNANGSTFRGQKNVKSKNIKILCQSSSTSNSEEDDIKPSNNIKKANKKVF